MKNQLLATKFFIPQKQQNWVSRPRLMKLLDASFSRKLTLLSMPAGFGKTTLVSDRVSQMARQGLSAPMFQLIETKVFFRI